MSSKQDDGESEPNDTTEESHIANLPDETLNTLADELDHEQDETIQDEDVDTIPQLNEITQDFEKQNKITNETSQDVRAIADDMEVLPSSPPPPSADGSASIPDDTPSIQDSRMSSPKSETRLGSPILSRKGSATSRRPFERRFQSRLSESYLGSSPRSSSPAFLNIHSRHSSLASFGPASDSAADDSVAPWEVIRWTKLKRVTGQAFSEVGRRNFGNPVCLAVTDNIIIGTSRGLILVYDHQQNHKTIIGSGTLAAECGAITSLAISADHTSVAAGHATGHIFTWEINRPGKPFLHIPAMDAAQAAARKGDGHVQGSSVLHIGFLGYRRTALVSADDKGMAFSHLASRGTGSLGRTVRTTRILGRYPELLVRQAAKLTKKSSVLAFSPLPLGNVEQSSDALGLVAMLTPYLLVIVSTTPVAQTQHKSPRPKEVAAHSAMTAALAWFPAIKLKGGQSETTKTKLVYAWSNVLNVLEVQEIMPEEDAPKDKPPEFRFINRNRYRAEEAIVAVQWLSQSVIAVLTITQQMLIIEDVTMNMTDSFDLLPKNLYHADLYSQQLQSIIEHHDEEDTSMHGVVADGYYMSFRAYKGRLFLLGVSDIWWGSLTNWADRLLAMMDIGDYIGAIRLASSYYSGSGEKVTIGLPEDDDARTTLVRERLLNMMSASLRYAFGKNEQASRQQADRNQLADLAVACISACLQMDEKEFLFDEVFSWYDDNDAGNIFVDVLEPHILDRQVSILPPSAVKTLINHFSETHTASKIEEIICLLDATAMDLDQVTTLCKQHNLYDAYIYVWNTAVRDFVGPLQDLIKLIPERGSVNGHAKDSNPKLETPSKMFPYLSFILTGRVYPLGDAMDNDQATSAKIQLYEFLFFGGADSNTPFASLRKILQFDTASFMAVMNEAFEDSFLNISQDSLLHDLNGNAEPRSGTKTINRQMIVQILLEVMSDGFKDDGIIYLDMFIARNLPKYSQYMRIRGKTLDQVLTRLCTCVDEELHEDAQLSVEYLLTAHQPSNTQHLVVLLEQAKFFRVLKSIFRKEHQWSELISVYLKDLQDREGVFTVIVECLQEHSMLTDLQRTEVKEVVTQHARELLAINIEKTAGTVDHVMPEAHGLFLQAEHEDTKEHFLYLKELFEPRSSTPSSNINNLMLESYVRLMCQFEPQHVVDYVREVKEGDLRLEEVMPVMESNGNVDAAIILLARQGQIGEAMSRLVKHFGALQTFLFGVLQSANESPDAVATNEAIEDLLESVNKYTRIGIWLCESQLDAMQKSRSMPKSPKRSMMQHQPLSFEESLWLDFLVAIVSIAQSITPSHTTQSKTGYGDGDDEDEVINQLRAAIQSAFTALLTTTTASRVGGRSDDFAFLRILRAFLTQVSQSSPSLSQLRRVIVSIFSAYSHEESLLSLSNAMLDKDLFIQVDEVAKLRLTGWRPRGQSCEICRRRVWGPGTGSAVWEAWKKRERQRKAQKQQETITSLHDEGDFGQGKGKAAEEVLPAPDGDEEQGEDVQLQDEQNGPVVVFCCRHIYHKKCLEQSQQIDSGEEFPASAQEPPPLSCPTCA